MLPPGVEPWTFLMEQAHSTQNRVHDPDLPSLEMSDALKKFGGPTGEWGVVLHDPLRRLLKKRPVF